MQLREHKGRSVFERCNIVSEGGMSVSLERLGIFAANKAEHLKSVKSARQVKKMEIWKSFQAKEIRWRTRPDSNGRPADSKSRVDGWIFG
jgi:hypothetical protein